jgi:phosphoribosylanthranilate isomerase
MTNAEDARAALALGADYVGFVLYAGSKRHVTPTTLRRLVETTPALTGVVGVFVNMPRREVEQVAADCGLVAVQLHGDEPAEDFAEMPVPVWRAVKRVGAAWVPAPASWPAPRYLVDAAVPGQYGGTGQVADWPAAAELARAHPVMLAGGLTPENVAEAVRAVQPLGVDVVSGVEKEPGRKDHARMAAFIRAARGG